MQIIGQPVPRTRDSHSLESAPATDQAVSRTPAKHAKVGMRRHQLRTIGCRLSKACMLTYKTEQFGNKRLCACTP